MQLPIADDDECPSPCSFPDGMNESFVQATSFSDSGPFCVYRLQVGGDERFNFGLAFQMHNTRGVTRDHQAIRTWVGKDVFQEQDRRSQAPLDLLDCHRLS